MINVVVIGDIHAGKGKMESPIKLITILNHMIERTSQQNKPDMIVFLGDTFDSHGTIDLQALVRLTNLFVALSVQMQVVVLIGNHDRMHSGVFQTDEHPLIGLKGRERILIADRACDVYLTDREHNKEHRFVFVPYVPPGRFAEALATLKVGIAEKRPSCVFSHQEFKGARAGSTTSACTEGWPLSAPLNIVGHYHAYQQLQPNLIYAGTPYQVDYGEPETDKTVMKIKFQKDSDNPVISRTEMGITRNRTVRVHFENLQAFVTEEKKPGNVKLIVEGDAAHWADMEAALKPLTEHGYKVQLKHLFPSADKQREELTKHTGETLRSILEGKLSEYPEAKTAYDGIVLA
jgi:DNA repair exonuclease SbcCD nuclease subunit